MSATTSISCGSFKRAVILAAGPSTRFAPLSFERPKALFRVRGEVLVERLIRQLREAGVEDITVVVGHMKERFFYLRRAFGVTLVEAPSFAERNNHASLWAVRDRLAGSFVCSSDQYFVENPFVDVRTDRPWVSVTWARGETEEQAVVLDGDQRIIEVQQGGSHTWCLQGPAYLTPDYAAGLVPLLAAAYDDPASAGLLWEQVATAHLAELPLWGRPLATGDVFEFDYLGDLCAFDGDFMDNVDSAILDNICDTLGCTRDQIHSVQPLKAGLSNLSVLFSVGTDRYVYRHPGAGTNELVNREAETIALRVASDLQLDTTFLHENPVEGWKISRFVPGCEAFDYESDEQVAQALGLVRRLHESGERSPYSFDFFDEAERITGLLHKERWALPAGFEALREKVASLVAPMRAGAGQPVLCHNDFYGPNLLVHGGTIELIDWEYAAMGDYGCDLGNFIAQGSGYSPARALEVLPFYFGAEPTGQQAFHCIACTAVVGWYWYVWALYKECKGASMGDWTETWRAAALAYSQEGLRMKAAVEVAGRPLTHEEFAVLVDAERGALDAGQLAAPVAQELLAEGLLTAQGRVSGTGLALLEPYRVRRAVFFAAGFGSRMLPVTINTPKPLVRVHGLRIIDRLLDAVVAAGIEEVLIVRGYLGEEFDQLLAKYPQVRFVDNPIFSETNNISSAVAAAQAAPGCFERAYVFESDLFLTDPSYISEYQYQSNYLGFPVQATADWCFDVNEDGVIVGIRKGSETPVWQMVGLSFWSAEDGARLARDLPAVFAEGGEQRQIFWDDVALRVRPDQYQVHVRLCDPGDVVEIDSFAELQAVDPAYRIG